MLLKNESSSNDMSTTLETVIHSMAIQLENDSPSSGDEGYFQYTLPNYYRSTLKKFRKVSRSTVHFHFLFLTAVILEISSFFIFFSSLIYSLALAMFLCSIFLTCFSYLVLLFYFQAKKPEQLKSLREEFIQSCRRILSTPPGNAQHHLLVAEASFRLSSYLQDFEWELYKVPPFLQFSSKGVSRFSAYFHWEDVFGMKQWLLNSAIAEHLKQIRITPTDLEVPASLASTYVALAKLYKDPIQSPNHPRATGLRKLKSNLEEKRIPS